jgi:hypothetical protein
MASTSSNRTILLAFSWFRVRSTNGKYEAKTLGVSFPDRRLRRVFGLLNTIISDCIVEVLINYKCGDEKHRNFSSLVAATASLGCLLVVVVVDCIKLLSINSGYLC